MIIIQMIKDKAPVVWLKIPYFFQIHFQFCTMLKNSIYYCSCRSLGYAIFDCVPAKLFTDA